MGAAFVLDAFLVLRDGEGQALALRVGSWLPQPCIPGSGTPPRPELGTQEQRGSRKEENVCSQGSDLSGPNWGPIALLSEPLAKPLSLTKPQFPQNEGAQPAWLNG